ncbi:uncharacterized protein A4U43_C01F22580 [Asparagus officinalis]|uniref:Uncharacterized protein n=1 Tax=Asparagus officinalis TaxID=4686 RepID=A0A5P1FVP0_ASPOF|nr:uncharacterized protein A4U43_C01F22580 [Asparagus officinalis]
MTTTVPKLESEDASILIIPRIPKSLTLIPCPRIPIPLQTLSPNLADERRRLRRFIACFFDDLPSLSSSSALALTFTLSNANKRKKSTPRSSNLRRVTFVDPDDTLLIRNAVRHTWILYESIRTCLLQEEESSPLPVGRRSHVDINVAMIMKNAAGNPLNSSVDAKLQAICQSLESSGKNNVNIESKPEPVVSLLTVETEESCSSSSVVTGATSFPVSEIESLDFNEVSWEDAEDFVLRKYPTYEID